MTPFSSSHQQLKNRYCFTGPLVLLSPLRVSSGRADDESDAPCIRTFDGTPYIPGSSLRGAIRAELERLLTSVTIANLRSCTLFTPEDCSSYFRNLMNDLEKSGKNQKEKDDAAVDFVKSSLCDVCGLFGSTMYASRLVIKDAGPVCSEEILHYVRIRDGVGIDRDTGAARDGAKFDYQVVEMGPEFSFSMVAENINDDKDRVLLTLILKLLKNGLYVGGKRAAGLGKIKLQSYEISGFERPDILWERLKAGEEIHQPLAWREEIDHA